MDGLDLLFAAAVVGCVILRVLVSVLQAADILGDDGPD